MKYCAFCGIELDRTGIHYCPMLQIDNIIEPEVAIRKEVDYRYDILDSEFLHMMAEIGYYGANKYGDYNWHKSRLTGGQSPINHMYMHLHQYKMQIEHDKFKTRKHQLAAIAFNAMMEFYYLKHMDTQNMGTINNISAKSVE